MNRVIKSIDLFMRRLRYCCLSNAAEDGDDESVPSEEEATNMLGVHCSEIQPMRQWLFANSPRAFALSITVM